MKENKAKTKRLGVVCTKEDEPKIFTNQKCTTEDYKLAMDNTEVIMKFLLHHKR